MQSILEKYGDMIMVGLIIIFGAFVNATATLKVKRDKKQEMGALDFFILLPIAIFSGILFGLTTKLITDSLIWILISSGVGSFLGLAGLNKIANVFLDAILQYANQKTKKTIENLSPKKDINDIS